MDHTSGTIVFRVDASVDIGTGHVMRCLTLAEELRRHGVATVFVCRPFDGDLREHISQRKHGLVSLSPARHSVEREPDGDYQRWLGVSWRDDASDMLRALASLNRTPDWLVVDHYALDARWEQVVKPHVGRIMVIDDLANRRHECEFLLDQNLHDRIVNRYDGLLSDNCVQLLGPRYALLRDEFRQVRAQMGDRSGHVKNVLIFFGGIDRTNLTCAAVRALSEAADLRLTADVVIGAACPHRAEVEQVCEHAPGVTLHMQTNRMAELMVSADLCIGAGGSTTWERAYMGLPSLVVVAAENQRELTDAAARCGICWNLGWHEEVTSLVIASRVREACANPQSLRKMSRQAIAISAHDHETGTGEVAARLMETARVYA